MGSLRRRQSQDAAGALERVLLLALVVHDGLLHLALAPHVNAVVPRGQLTEVSGEEVELLEDAQPLWPRRFGQFYYILVPVAPDSLGLLLQGGAVLDRLRLKLCLARNDGAQGYAGMGRGARAHVQTPLSVQKRDGQSLAQGAGLERHLAILDGGHQLARVAQASQQVEAPAQHRTRPTTLETSHSLIPQASAAAKR